MSDNKIHVYLMPGMAANASIFEGIKLPKDQFITHTLEWFVPEKGMSLIAYAQKMCEKIEHPDPVLLGVSFGGMLVQEMAKIIPVKKVIVVSSVKSKHELPKRMIFAKYTKVHKLLPTGLVNNVELLAKYAFGETVTKRLYLYEKYLSVRDKYYIDWSIDQIVNWDQEAPADNVVHIQGERDAVFPIVNIEDCITVKNGTHTMIIHRARWFNEHLPTIILE
ncbi:alpha/beta hydrolase [Flagellimonas oceanensis]|uniref:alpha/beta hydrolase n=1 Tax=Flagellimonas oceanensis TaxID=2499163 RepID=UPI000F8D132B|nr:alpha/beta hydrolase [Allomuricauda oceanensis]|tara:strand:+ start:20991 stop:21653 length:663 start_codon:yes stop_codon:yes gene_type:complete